MSDANVVLIIDDEPNNVRALKIDLEHNGYTTLTAEDGVRGWEVLKSNAGTIKAILLDRMMPNMNGLQFMEQLVADPEVANIPVVMQTAAAEKAEVVEGIEAGVYYYLTKPYDKDVMLSVVGAAIKAYSDYQDMSMALGQFKNKLHMVKECHFEVKYIEDARYLAVFLANFFPKPDRVVMGISELLINAIEHGNLGISYDLKTELNSQGRWLEEVGDRLQMSENKDKKVRITYVQNEEEITLRICDQGKGFNWGKYGEISPERASDNHGRGIALSRMISFDTMEYLGCGNEVLCTVRLS